MGSDNQSRTNCIAIAIEGQLKGIGVDTSITLIQKSAFLGSVRLLRKVLEM